MSSDNSGISNVLFGTTVEYGSHVAPCVNVTLLSETVI